MSTISIIVAIAENGAIGKQQELLCHLPNDLKRFKEITVGHAIVMGRKTYESLPKGALPGRTNIVLTSSKSLAFPNCVMANSLEQALDGYGNDDEVFIIGGAAVYKAALKIADKLYITRIHHTFEDADTFFPAIDDPGWEETEREAHPADEKHKYPYTFTTYIRKG